MSDADQCRNEAGDAQPALRRLQRCRHGAPCRQRKRGEENSFDREEQADRRQEIGHQREPPGARGVELRLERYFGAEGLDAAAPGKAGPGVCSGACLPDGSEK